MEQPHLVQDDEMCITRIWAVRKRQLMRVVDFFGSTTILTFLTVTFKNAYGDSIWSIGQKTDVLYKLTIQFPYCYEENYAALHHSVYFLSCVRTDAMR
jgi:hypothetical protein